jgi:hypothetical protein
MSQLHLNGVDTPIDPSLQTWRELLLDLECKRLSKDHVISSVRFDGDEVTHFRGDGTLDLRLESIEQIRVEVIATKQMLQDAVREAEGYLLNLEASLVDVAEAFRNGQAEQANLKLQHIFAGIKMQIALVRGIELSLPPVGQSGTSRVEETLGQMGPTLQELIVAQTQQDWTLVADILEYELVAHLGSFEGVLSRFKPDLDLG